MTSNTRKTQLERPRLRSWRRANDITMAAAAAELGVSEMQIRRYELPFSNPKRQTPRAEVMARIFAWSDGQLTPRDFYPAHLSPIEESAREPAEAAP